MEEGKIQGQCIGLMAASPGAEDALGVHLGGPGKLEPSPYSFVVPTQHIGNNRGKVFVVIPTADAVK